MNSIEIGDFNSIVRKGPTNKVVRPFRLGRRNVKDKMLRNFCWQHDLLVMNIWFKKRKMKLYTRKSPRGWKHYHINYILVKQRFKNSVRDKKTLPGENIDSVHNLLVEEVQTRLKAIKEAGMGKLK